VGGIITGVAGNTRIGKYVCGIYNYTNNGNVTISNCQIYGKDEANITGSIYYALYRYHEARFYKGDSGSATIQDIRGSGGNLWNSGFTWD